VSAFGIVSNTGRAGLGWSDRERYTGSSTGISYDEENGVQYTFNGGDEDDLSGGWDGRFSGEGLPSVWTGGLHYANKWRDNTEHLSANYRYAKNNVSADG